MKLADLRQDYRLASLDISDVANDPIEQFKKWFDEAVKSELLEPNAMTLATVSAQGKPSARVVLLKGIENQGFVFYTNYESRKGEQLAANPNAALCFCWLELQRQVRIEGTIEKIDAAASDAYFQSRPVGSRIGAWASPQSDVIEDRAVLEQNEAFYKKRFDTEGVLPRPEHWGGYILKPTLIEFWQGRSSRLHDRILYVFDGAEWDIVRLAP
jgi:pyridoxamine 5'-phosphate oxidase